MRTGPAIGFGSFEESGFAGPIAVLSARERGRFLRAATEAQEPRDWWKGHAASSRVFYDMGSHPSILGPVARILGDDVILWGASIASRAPDQIHPWHSDIESARSSNRTVAVWIGLENTTSDSSLRLVSHSHRFDVTIQEVRHKQGRLREEPTAEDLLAIARQRDDRASLVQVEMTDGDALFFDGKLWHGSHNLLRATRHALLLQYATAESEIRIPDPAQVDWPFRQFASPRPPCVIVKGQASTALNRIVDPPPLARSSTPQTLPSRIAAMPLPLEPDASGWKPYPNFQGATASLANLSSHASSLAQGTTPHPPHRHIEEEILLLISGEVELELPELGADQGGPIRHLTAGELVYYPAYFPHTLTTVSAEPANYLMFKWNRSSLRHRDQLGFGQFRVFGETEGIRQGFHPSVVFEGSTAHLRRLQCHASTLTPGAGYDAHADPYDVAIVLLEGEFETLGERVGRGGVVFCPQGELHGMLGTGGGPAKYVVLEFEGRRPVSAVAASARRLWAKITDSEVVRGKLRYELKRLRRSS